MLLTLPIVSSIVVIIFYPPESPNVFISTSPIGFNLPASLIAFFKNYAFFIFTCILIGRILVIIDRWCRSRVVNPSLIIIIICCCLGDYWHLVYFGNSNRPVTKWYCRICKFILINHSLQQKRSYISKLCRGAC